MSLGPLEVNQHVVARCRDGKHRWSHKWFPGVVRRINEDGTVAIDYEDGDQEERVPRKHACRREEEQALPTTLKLTGSGRRSTETDRLSSSKLGGELQYGKRMVKPLKSTPKRRAQERKEACVSPSCIQNLLGVLLLVRPTPAEEEEEEQEEGEVKLIGSRIRVYWTVAKAWYAGRVISAGRGVGGILHTVAYDDNTTQTHYLQSAESSLNERWQFEPSLECKTPAKAAALKLLLSAVSEPSVVVGWCDEWFLEAGLEVIEDSDGGAEEAEELVIHLGNTAGGVAANTCLAWPPPQPSSEQEEERVRRPALSGAEHDSDSMPSPRSASSSSSSSESDEAEVWYDEAVLEEEHDSDPMPSMHSASSPSTSASTSTGASGSGESNDAASDDAAEAEAEAEADEAVAEAEEAEVVSGWGSESEEDEAEDE